MKSGKEQLGGSHFLLPFLPKRVSQPFPKLLQQLLNFAGGFLCEKLLCPDLPNLCLQALLLLVLQLSHYHLKVICWPSELFFGIFSNYLKPMWEREVLFIETPPWVTPRI